MTTAEMITNTLLEYDLNGSGAVAGFEEEEVLAFLNKAQIAVVKQLYKESRADNLQILVNYDSAQELTPAVAEYQNNNAYAAIFPSNFLFFLSARCLLTRTALPLISTPSWVENQVINKEESARFMASSANQTIFYNPVLFESSNNFITLVDSLTTIEPINLVGIDSNFMLTYLRYPLTLTAINTCELEEIWHQDIVDLALRYMLLVTNDVRVRQVITKDNK